MRQFVTALVVAALAVGASACSDAGERNTTYFTPNDTVEEVGIFDPGDVTLPDTSQPDTTQPDTVEPDTSEPIDTSEPVDTSPPLDTSEPDTATCVEGLGCNDNDPCTFNDQCVEGQCQGTPLNCDDQIPCTEDVCVSGFCRSTVMDGSCLIDTNCWSNQQVNPNNFCERCVSADNAEGWTSSVGLKCDDGDPCTQGEECGEDGACAGGVIPPETCEDGVDNDCNGDTDDEDVACGGTPTCDFHYDCYPEQLCALWNTTGERVCSDPCAGAGDCADGQICSKLPGSAQIGFCQDAQPGLLPAGSACTDDSQCTGRVCVDNLCEDICFNEVNCSAPLHTCHPVGDLSIGLVQTSCADTSGAGLLNLGQGCYDGASCVSGHCDVMNLINSTCSPTCKSQGDCAPTQECGIVLYSPIESPEAVPYHPQYQQPTHDAFTACYDSLGSGSGPIGSVCTHPDNCSTHMCLGLVPNDPTYYCTSYCTHDIECPTGMQCKADVITMGSTWLQNPAITGGQSINLNIRSLVRICKFE